MKKRLCAALLALSMAIATVGCGNSKSTSFHAAADMAAPEYAVTEEPVEDFKDDVEMELDSGMTEAGSGATKAETVQTSEKIIYTYNYSVETKQFDEFMDAVQKRINEYGGYLESSETNGNREMNIRRYANLVIRIPADRMHAFLNMVEEQSNVTYSSTSTENVTLSYVDLQSHIKALKTEQETLLGILEQAKKLEDIITIQNQLTNIRYELESYESQLRVFDNRINYSTLYLDVNEVERETNVATELTFGQEITRGLSDTMYSIGRGFREFAIWFIVNLPILLIWAVVIVLILFILRKVIKIYTKRKLRKATAREADTKQTASGIWSSAASAEEYKKTEEKREEK